MSSTTQQVAYPAEFENIGTFGALVKVLATLNHEQYKWESLTANGLLPSPTLITVDQLNLTNHPCLPI